MMMILTGDRFYPNAENLLSILILQFVLFMHVFHLLYFVSNDNNKDVQSIINLPLFVSENVCFQKRLHARGKENYSNIHWTPI